MLHNIWDSLLYKPFVNLLAVLVSIMPGGDLGLAVIILTILVKTALFPLSQRSIESQAKMKLLEPEIAKIKAGGASKEEQARLTFELYKTHKTNPFSGCLLVLIQIPIIFALYYVFFKGINFDSNLYSFVKIPTHINANFLGLIDLNGKSLVALLSNANEAWPDSVANLQYKGYRLDAGGTPEFSYKIADTDLKITLIPENGSFSVKIKALKPTTGLFVRMAVGQQISEIEPGLFEIDGQRYFVNTSNRPILRSNNGKQELLLSLTDAINYSLIW